MIMQLSTQEIVNNISCTYMYIMYQCYMQIEDIHFVIFISSIVVRAFAVHTDQDRMNKVGPDLNDKSVQFCQCGNS